MIATAEISFEQMKVINTDTSKGIWPTAKVFINNCEWNNSELFGKRKLYITNSNIIWDNIVTSIPAELISVNNSKFNVRYNCTKDVFKNVIFSNNSEILLEQYNSNVKLNIPSSNEGTDYTVKYNGTQSLTS